MTKAIRSQSVTRILNETSKTEMNGVIRYAHRSRGYESQQITANIVAVYFHKPTDTAELIAKLEDATAKLSAKGYAVEFRNDRLWVRKEA